MKELTTVPDCERCHSKTEPRHIRSVFWMGQVHVIIYSRCSRCREVFALSISIDELTDRAVIVPDNEFDSKKGPLMTKPEDFIDGMAIN